MKASIKDDKGFRPITIKIQVETLGELYNLWHRFNITGSKIKEYTCDNYPIGDDNSYDLFCLIDEKLEEICKK